MFYEDGGVYRAGSHINILSMILNGCRRGIDASPSEAAMVKRKYGKRVQDVVLGADSDHPTRANAAEITSGSAS